MDLSQSLDLTNGANLLRILCGLFLIPHLFVKFKNQDFVKGFMAKAGLNPPIAWLYGAFAVEIVASIGLILGLYTVYVALLTAAFLLVALLLLLWPSASAQQTFDAPNLVTLAALPFSYRLYRRYRIRGALW